MGRKRLPDSQLTDEALRKRRLRDAKAQFAKNPRLKNKPVIALELLKKLGTNRVLSPPKQMRDPEDGSLDWDKVRKFSKAGNEEIRQKIANEQEDLARRYGRVVERPGAAAIILRIEEKKWGNSDSVRSERTYRNRIKSIIKSAKPERDIR